MQMMNGALSADDEQHCKPAVSVSPVSMVESTSSVPFDVSQLVNVGTTTTVTLDSQQVGAIPAIVSDTSTFSLSSSSERSEK